jgi:hypothetical protein
MKDGGDDPSNKTQQQQGGGGFNWLSEFNSSLHNNKNLSFDYTSFYINV